MMQIPFTRIFEVIFVLSTIVVVTNCCSSRILLLREHTLKIVQHQHSHMHEHAHELQQQIQETAVELLNRLELQRKQLENSAQEEAAEQLRPESNANEETETQQPIVETDADSDAMDPAEETDFFESSTATWLISDSSTPIAASETVTTPETVTHTGEPPPDQSSSSHPTVSSTPIPLNKETEIQMLPCSEAYNTSFCLNGGHCFQHPMVNNTVFHSCLCVNDYDGERCAYKSWNGDYVYTPSTVQRKVRMAHIVFSFPVLIMLSSLYVLFAAVFMLRNVPDYRRKQQQLHLHKQRFFVTC
ncbi:protein gurken [Drosophila subpulchrella]|uniref:protein gurken n=1 Tax=Drosophila subpulchrella TaxID=1486046 RepID=UPI0018A1A71D|nr:protein gurken [Drosophila subpulchrella]XP_037708388.1 protein gurken [Drosophila subpulchrella]